MYHVKLFIMEKMRFGIAPRWCGIHSKPQPLLQKNCLFYASETLATYVGLCLHTLALAYVRKLLPTYVGWRPLWSLISKNRFLLILKSYIFHFNTLEVNLISDWALNWSWVLEFEHHWGTGARVIKGTKCGVYMGLR